MYFLYAKTKKLNRELRVVIKNVCTCTICLSVMQVIFVQAEMSVYHILFFFTFARRILLSLLFQVTIKWFKYYHFVFFSNPNGAFTCFFINLIPKYFQLRFSSCDSMTSLQYYFWASKSLLLCKIKLTSLNLHNDAMWNILSISRILSFSFCSISHIHIATVCEKSSALNIYRQKILHMFAWCTIMLKTGDAPESSHNLYIFYAGIYTFHFEWWGCIYCIYCLRQHSWLMSPACVRARWNPKINHIPSCALLLPNRTHSYKFQYTHIWND